MASLEKSSAGYIIRIVGSDGKRRPIRLGKLNKKQANEIKLKVEHLHALTLNNLPMDAVIAEWVGKIGDELAAKFAAVGLIHARSSRKLGEFLDHYLEGRKLEVKSSTITQIDQVVKDLKALFGADTGLRSIGPEDAERMKASYQERELAGATTYRRLKMARMLFERARMLKLINENPFAQVKSKNANPAENRRYITLEDAHKLMAVANPTWRTIIALSRIAGLRCPSEVLLLKWEHVDFAAGRMTVSSPKTEHYEGRAYRVVPIFADLRPYLEDAHELAEPGEVFVVGGKQGATYRAASKGKNGWVNCNLRTTFEKIIRRANLTQWPRLFHNMRASCETDLMQDHGIHVVTAWLGNTPKIALQHYLQTLDRDFEKAILGNGKSGAESGAQKDGMGQNTGQSTTAGKSLKTTEATESVETVGSGRFVSSRADSGTLRKAPRVGFEPSSSTNGATTLCDNPLAALGAESGAVLANGQNLEVLAALVGILTPEQKAAFLALLTAPKAGA